MPKFADSRQRRSDGALAYSALARMYAQTENQERPTTWATREARTRYTSKIVNGLCHR